MGKRCRWHVEHSRAAVLHRQPSPCLPKISPGAPACCCWPLLPPLRAAAAAASAEQKVRRAQAVEELLDVRQVPNHREDLRRVHDLSARSAGGVGGDA